MKVQLSQVHWGRVLSAAILIAILSVILNLILSFLVFHIWGKPDQTQIALQVAVWSSSIVTIALTLASAAWVARKGEREPQLHGFLVGLIAALILFLLSSGFQGQFVLVTLVSTALTIAAGWLGGVLGNRGR